MISLPEACFFDLDGTLLDTAPDLLSALNQLRKVNGLDNLLLNQIRHMVNSGSKALLKMSFNLDETSPRFNLLREELLVLYEKQIANQTSFFPDIQEILN